MTDATKFESLVVTGDKALTVSALNANVTSINASGMTTGGSFTQSGRSQTTAANYVGSVGNDTFIMAHGNDVIDGAAGTGDTLVVTGNYILGGIQIALSATGDQVTTFNGSANAAIQSGFESVNLSAITGSAQADITAVSTGSTIVGTRNADQITGGAGADSISMGVSNIALVFDAINAAGGTDTLNILGTFTLSATESQNVIDLSSTSDQVGTLNNVTEAVVQIGFENVDVSGLTMTAGSGLTITAGTTGSVIVGSSTTDTINAGAGVDTITGGGGLDTIVIGAASGTGVATAGTTVTSTATLDKVILGDLADDDTISLAAILATEGSYDAFTTISNGGNISLTVAAAATPGTVSLITGIYDAVAQTFTSTTAGATTNAVLISASASDTATTATDSIVIVGAAGLLHGDFAISNGIITA